MNKTIFITGVSGTIGTALSRFFLTKNYRVRGFTRNPATAEKLKGKGIEPVLWDGVSLTGWEKELEGADVVINLSGENIGSGRWTQQKKDKILNSRIDAGKLVTEALSRLDHKPEVYLQASAVGYYGSCGDEKLAEGSPAGEGFLAEVVRQWEAASDAVEGLGVRRVIGRFGMVLNKNEGTLKRMLLPFRFFVGGPLGPGTQWMSWIHIDDVIQGIDFLISCQDCRGIFNFTTPHPVRNREFARTLGKVLHQPSFLPVPSFVLKILLGEMAEQLPLSSQRVLPKRLKEAGFTFRFQHLAKALKDLLK
ncbi:MAG: TIGR01777 family oxidoreductase [Candidatus Aminicenantes bacterium]|jgi:uncharacterized protein (TIGR01777 family)